MKNMKKLLIALLVFAAFTIPNVAEARGFSGGHSSISHSITSHRSTGTYHSGYKSPSSHVNRSNSSHTGIFNQPSRGRSIATHAAAFGAGALVGSMFHPFGGAGYGFGGSYGNGGIPFLGLLIDILIVAIIIWIIRRIFGGGRRY